MPSSASAAPAVAPLPAHRVGDAAAVMAEALHDSPAYVAFLRGDKGFRRRALAWILARNIAAVRARNPAAVRCVFDAPAPAAPAEPAILATYMLTAAEDAPSDWELVVAGLAWVPFLFGPRVFMRMRGVMAWFARAARASFSTWSPGALLLERVTVRPDFQRRGLGSACVRHAMAEAGAAGVPLRLSTQEESNVRFYRRLGFEVTAEHEFEAELSEFSFNAWFMEEGAERGAAVAPER